MENVVQIVIFSYPKLSDQRRLNIVLIAKFASIRYHKFSFVLNSHTIDEEHSPFLFCSSSLLKDLQFSWKRSVTIPIKLSDKYTLVFLFTHNVLIERHRGLERNNIEEGEKKLSERIIITT